MPLLVYKAKSLFANPKVKSPIKDKPLRNPGESLDKQIIDNAFDNILPYLTASVLVFSLALQKWQHWFFNTSPSPWISSLVAFVVVCYSLPKVIYGFKNAKNLKQGRDGEKAVGQYLESLRENGAKVFHDIPGTNFNIDHVVVCTSGVYVIETKTYSKPAKGECKVLFSGENLSVNGNKPTDKPLIQVQAASNWLKLILEQSTGNKYLVKPVILFPGWFIETTYEAKHSDIWVLNPKGLPTFIANSQELLNPEQVKMIAFLLSRYIRTFQENK